jgi:hypothetical protein
LVHAERACVQGSYRLGADGICFGAMLGGVTPRPAGSEDLP